MENPTKYIREAYWNAITNLGYPVYVGQVPLSENLSGLYVILSTQDKQERRLCKTCPLSWNVSITINIINVTEAGQTNLLPIDDCENAILGVINECEGIIEFEGYEITKTTIANSFNDDLELPTQHFSRQILRVEHQIHES